MSFPAGSGGWTYVHEHRRKPHIHPLVTPAGHVLSRVEPPDHPWQRGLWFAIKFVDGINFWEELGAGCGVIRHDGEPTVEVDSVEGDVAWIAADRTTVALRERRRWTHHRIDDDAYAIDLDTTLAAPAGALLDRSPFNGLWGGYSGITLRGRHHWRDTRLLLDDGTEVDRVAPQASRWCDLSGWIDTPDGAVEAGVAVFDHPANPRHPAPFYASTKAPDYGDEGWTNFVNPAWLWDGPHRLAPADALRLRYRTVVHDHRWSAERLDAAWAYWAEVQSAGSQ